MKLLHRQINIKDVMPDAIRHPLKFMMDSVFQGMTGIAL